MCFNSLQNSNFHDFRFKFATKTLLTITPRVNFEEMKISIFLISLIALEAGCMEINCDYRYNYNFHILDFAYYCHANDLKIAGDPVNVKKVTGNHKKSPKGAIYSDLDPRLFYVNCSLAYIKGDLKVVPQGLTKFFPYLTGIWIDYCPLESLTAGELKEYRDLDYFTIRYSKLKTLPANLFSNSPRLVFVDFAFNELVKIPYQTIADLKILKIAWFNHNPCTGKGVEGQATYKDFTDLINFLKTNC